ncbi:MAG: histidine phosphatase family protein [Dehalococcoidia bacterium]|nr:histidine phosphatase family protein [Dehalococcoidia bacterium]
MVRGGRRWRAGAHRRLLLRRARDLGRHRAHARPTALADRRREHRRHDRGGRAVTLLLARHAQSAANASGVMTGWLDVPLTEAGRAQAAALAERLAGEPVVAVYASPLGRALATAQPTAARLGLAVTTVEGLREAGLGEAQGLRWPEVRDRWTTGHGAIWADAIPGAEPGAAVRARVAAVLEELLERHRDELVLCVAHAGTITHALQHVLGLPMDRGPRLPIYHAALTVIDGRGREPVLVALNDRCHLEALEQPGGRAG